MSIYTTGSLELRSSTGDHLFVTASRDAVGPKIGIGMSSAPNTTFAIGGDLSLTDDATNTRFSVVNTNAYVNLGTDDSNMASIIWEGGASDRRVRFGTKAAGVDYFNTMHMKNGAVGIGGDAELSSPAVDLHVQGASKAVMIGENVASPTGTSTLYFGNASSFIQRESGVGGTDGDLLITAEEALEVSAGENIQFTAAAVSPYSLLMNSTGGGQVGTAGHFFVAGGLYDNDVSSGNKHVTLFPGGGGGESAFVQTRFEQVVAARSGLHVTGSTRLKGNVELTNTTNSSITIDAIAGTDQAGKSLTVGAGQSTGDGVGGSLTFQVARRGAASGASVNAFRSALTLSDDGSSVEPGAVFAGDVTVGNELSISGNKISFSDGTDLSYNTTHHSITGTDINQFYLRNEASETDPMEIGVFHSKVNVASGDGIGRYSFGGKDSGVVYSNTAHVEAYAAETWTHGSAEGTNIRLGVTPTGAASKSIAVVISALYSSFTGKVQVGGDTSASDVAAIGYSAVDGCIITGDGTTNDVTLRNTLNEEVLSIPNQTKNVDIAGQLAVSGSLIVVQPTNDANATLTLSADKSDDAGDSWILTSRHPDQNFTIGNDINSKGTPVDHLIIVPNATPTDSTIEAVGNLTVGNELTVTNDIRINGDDIKDSGGNTVLSFDGAGNIDNKLSVKNSLSPNAQIAHTSTVAASPARLVLLRNPTDGNLSSGDELSNLDFRGTTNAAGGDVYTGAQIKAITAETWDTTGGVKKSGANLLLRTTTPGTSVSVDRLEIGSLGMTGSVAFKFVDAGAAGGNTSFYLNDQIATLPSETVGASAWGKPEYFDMFFQNTSFDSHSAAGIGFGTSAGNTGAGLIYVDRGNYAQGQLNFAVKSSTSTGVSPDVAMVLSGSTSTVRSDWMRDRTTSDAGAYDYLAVGNVNGEIRRWTSDRRGKKDIQDLNNSLDEICQLIPRLYRDINQPDDRTHFSPGLIADEVESVIPELVTGRDLPADKLRGVSYHALSVYIINALKEIKQRIEILEAE
jgi:hypothetical protein